MGFRTGAYNPSEPLIIDPYITSSTTYIGGSRSDAVTAMAAVPGAMLIAGWSESQDLPPSALAPRGSEDVQAFVMKVNTTTGAVEYATWFGGTGHDMATAIAADASGNAWLAGYTASDGLATAGAAQTVRSGTTDAFIARLTPQGAVSWATYLGGSGADRARSVVLTPSGTVWIAGETESSNFPVRNPVQAAFGGGTSDAFAARYSAAGALEYATWLGGAGTDQANAIASDTASNVYLTGFTESWNYPAVNALQPGWAGGQDAFVTKLAANGASIAYSTFLGGSAGSAAQPESGNAIAADASGVAIVAGSAASVNFPLSGSLQTFRGGTDAFLARIHPTGTSLVASTLYGDSGSDTALALAPTADGGVYFSGSTTSDAFPDLVPWQGAGGGLDGFVVRLGPASQVVVASRIGGGGNDTVTALAAAPGTVYAAGQTASITFQPGSSARVAPDGFLLRLDEIPVNIDLNSIPSGLAISVSGTGCAAGSYVTPVRLAWTMGASCTLSVSTLQTVGDTRWRFARWTGGSTAASWTVYTTAAAAAYTAEFTAEYKLTTSVSPVGAGTISVTPWATDGFYQTGTVVQLAAAAAAGWQFSSWSGGGPTVVMDVPKSITATFGSSVYDAVISAPAGLAWTASGTGCNPGTYSGAATLRWTHGSTCSVSVAAVQGGGDTRWRFAGWSDGSPANPRSFTAGAGSWAMVFAAEHKLTTAASPPGSGSVTATPASADGFYPVNTSVQLTPSPAAGWQFASWSGGAASVVMDVPKSVTATFGSSAYDAVISAPAGLVWTASGTGCNPGTYSGSATLRWTHGSTCSVSVAAVQGGGDTRWRFAGWSDGSAANPRSFTAAAGSWTMLFSAEHRLTLSASPAAGGSATASPGSADGFYTAGTTVQLGVLPARGFQFLSWSGTSMTTVVMTAPRAIIANFAAQTGPSAVSVAPASGAGSAQTFSALYSTSLTGAAIEKAFWLLGADASGAAACFIEYTVAMRQFRLMGDKGTSWSAPTIAGSATPLANSQCTLTTASSSARTFASGMDTRLELTLTVSFHRAFRGDRNAYLLASNDTLSMNSGWVRAGSWKVITGNPALTTLTPDVTTGTSGTYTGVFTHSGGASELYLGYILFLPTPNIVWYTAKGSCLVEYNRISNGIRLINETGDGWLGPIEGVAIRPGAPPLANSRCQVDVAATRVSISENDMAVTVSVSFKPGFSGVLATFLQAQDVNGNWTGMTQFGNATAYTQTTPKSGPFVESVQLSSTANSAAITLTTGHTASPGQLGMVHVLISDRIVGGSACQIVYFPLSNTLNLVNDAGSDMATPAGLKPGAGALANSRCGVIGTQTSALAWSSMVSLKIATTFQSATFAGRRHVYVNVFDIHGNLTHWVYAGSLDIK